MPSPPCSNSKLTTRERAGSNLTTRSQNCPLPPGALIGGGVGTLGGALYGGVKGYQWGKEKDDAENAALIDAAVNRQKSANAALGAIGGGILGNVAGSVLGTIPGALANSMPLAQAGSAIGGVAGLFGGGIKGYQWGKEQEDARRQKLINQALAAKQNTGGQ